MPELSSATTDSGILIVDDDPIAIHVIRRALDEYMNVRFATNGSDALRLMAEQLPDLVLLDGDMPGESGFDVCRKIKADAVLREVPVVFVTAHDDLEFETRALQLGAADFIGKPVSAPRMRLRVALHLQLKQQLDQLRALARTDGLTELANRRTVDETLAREWMRAHRSGLALSLVLVDVDHFKRYNDCYGHPAGDACLKQVALALASVARRPTDLAGRFGGEEFALVLADTELDGARHVAENLQRALARAAIPHRASPVADQLTLSIGIACRAGHRDSQRPRSDPALRSTSASLTHEALIAAADRALYAAKDRGRNRIEAVQLSARSREALQL